MPSCDQPPGSLFSSHDVMAYGNTFAPHEFLPLNKKPAWSAPARQKEDSHWVETAAYRLVQEAPCSSMTYSDVKK